MTRDADNWDRLQQLAHQAVPRGFIHGMWKDDLYQAALLAAWQHRTEPDPLIVTIAKRAAVNEHRLIFGRAGTTRNQTETISLNPDNDRIMGTCASAEAHADPVLTWGLTGQQREIAERLLAGHPQERIAAHFGVTPSRISHIVAKMRADVLRRDQPSVTDVRIGSAS